MDDEGQIGGLAGYQYNSFTVSGTMVRSDWVEKVGMTVDGLQTIDDYYNYLTAIKAQGLCEYPMPLRYDASISGSPFLAAMGARAGAAGESSFPVDIFHLSKLGEPGPGRRENPPPTALSTARTISWYTPISPTPTGTISP